MIITALAYRATMYTQIGFIGFINAQSACFTQFETFMRLVVAICESTQKLKTAGRRVELNCDT